MHRWENVYLQDKENLHNILPSMLSIFVTDLLESGKKIDKWSITIEKKFKFYRSSVIEIMGDLILFFLPYVLAVMGELTIKFSELNTNN
jgi:hypothetical protein